MAYGSDQGLIDYATASGRTFTGDATVARTVASKYINGKAFWDRWVGTPVDPYGDAWPRNGIQGVSNTTVPTRVEQATYEAALIWAENPTALQSGAVTNNGSGAIASEQVDVLRVSYHAPMSDDSIADATVIDNTPRFSQVEDCLGPFIRDFYGASTSAFVV